MVIFSNNVASCFCSWTLYNGPLGTDPKALVNVKHRRQRMYVSKILENCMNGPVNIGDDTRIREKGKDALLLREHNTTICTKKWY